MSYHPLFQKLASLLIENPFSWIAIGVITALFWSIFECFLLHVPQESQDPSVSVQPVPNQSPAGPPARLPNGDVDLQ